MTGRPGGIRQATGGPGAGVGGKAGPAEAGSASGLALSRGGFGLALSRGGSGLAVALIGPDGAGKTTMSKALAARAPLRAKRIYMGTNPEARDVGLPGADRVRRARAAREGFSAVRHGLVFLHQLADHWYRYALARWHRARGGIVLFDRYVHPPPDRSGEGVARRVRARLFRAGAPTPDLVVVLDAPPEVLAERKKEHGVERMREVRRDVARVASRLPGAVVLNVDRAPAEVEDALLALIRSRLDENRNGRSRAKGSRWAARR